MMACIGGHADVLKVLVEEFGMSTNISDFVSQSIYSVWYQTFPLCIYMVVKICINQYDQYSPLLPWAQWVIIHC